MGSSIAYWLKERALDGLDVVVVERDPLYKSASTVLSVGGVRQQFSLKENIELSLYSVEFFRNIKKYLGIEGHDPPDIQFTPSGYLFLATEQSAHVLQDNAALQTSLGAKVELLSPSKLKEKFPWLNTDGIALGSHGLENEGWFDPWSLLFAFKRKAVSLGAHYVTGEVTQFGFKKANDIVTEDLDVHDFKNVGSVTVRLSDGTEKEINFGVVVIAAGPFSGEVGQMAGMGNGVGPLLAPLPITPRKRYVYNIHCPDGPGLNSPLMIDPSGAYFRREGLGGNYICGLSPNEDEEPDASNLDVDYNFFEERVWPILANRVPSFCNIKMKSAWAGYYDYNSFDENAFIGPHPAYHNLYIAAGFSGHGIQQSPAVGRAIMELIVDGQFITCDLSRLGFQRYLQREPLWESNIV